MWLDDEVINFFFQLLKQRDDALVAAAAAKGEERRKNWFFSSFFISKLLDDDNGYNHAKVKRWSSNAGDLFTYDKVFFPQNIDNSHWCLAVIHMQDKKIEYFDSSSGTGRAYLPHLLRYLKDDQQHKEKAPLDFLSSSSSFSCPSSLPPCFSSFPPSLRPNHPTCSSSSLLCFCSTPPAALNSFIIDKRNPI